MIFCINDGDGKEMGTPGNLSGQLFLRRQKLARNLFTVEAKKTTKAAVNALRLILIALVCTIVVGIAIKAKLL